MFHKMSVVLTRLLAIFAALSAPSIVAQPAVNHSSANAFQVANSHLLYYPNQIPGNIPVEINGAGSTSVNNQQCNASDRGRYVCIYADVTDPDAIDEVRVLDAFGYNIAAGKTVTSNLLAGYEAAQILDGGSDISAHWADRPTYGRAIDQGVWQIDLGANMPVSRIEIDGTDEITNAQVEFLSDVESFDSIPVLWASGPGGAQSVFDSKAFNTEVLTSEQTNRATVRVNFFNHEGVQSGGFDHIITTQTKGDEARFLRISLPNHTNYLELAEVEVIDYFQRNVTQLTDDDGNRLAKAYQISDYNPTYPAENAIDGNRDGNAYAANPSISITKPHHGSWWYVDLSKSHFIDHINIFARTDHNYDFRWEGIQVELISEDDLLVQWFDHQQYGLSRLSNGKPGHDYNVGRYVRISLPGKTEYLSLPEVRVIDRHGNNVALNQPATQSSIYAGLGAQNAVDGNINGHYYNSGRSLAMTNGDPSPWWMVDLGQNTEIKRIEIYNRTDATPHRLNDAKIELLPEGTISVDWINHPQFSQTFVQNAQGSNMGRYVRISLPGNNRLLSLAEVEVFDQHGNNVALNKTASQSSHYSSDSEAEKAIDGNTDGHYFNSHSVSHTLWQAEPWWMVDLGENVDIASIRIHNRTDCCAGRLNGAKVEVIEDAPTMTGRYVRFSNLFNSGWQLNYPGLDKQIQVLDPLGNNLAAGKTITSSDEFIEIDLGADMAIGSIKGPGVSGVGKGVYSYHWERFIVTVRPQNSQPPTNRYLQASPIYGQTQSLLDNGWYVGKESIIMPWAGMDAVVDYGGTVQRLGFAFEGDNILTQLGKEHVQKTIPTRQLHTIRVYQGSYDWFDEPMITRLEFLYRDEDGQEQVAATGNSDVTHSMYSVDVSAGLMGFDVWTYDHPQQAGNGVIAGVRFYTRKPSHSALSHFAACKNTAQFSPQQAFADFTTKQVETDGSAEFSYLIDPASN